MLVLLVLRVLVMTTTRSTRSVVGLHIVHLACKSINRGVLAGLLLSTGLRQLGHRGRNGLSCRGGGIDRSCTRGGSDRPGRSNWDSWHDAARLLGGSSVSRSMHGLGYRGLGLNGRSRRILGRRSRVAASGLLVSTRQLGGGLRSGHTRRAWTLLWWLSWHTEGHLRRELTRSTGRKAMARRREPAGGRSAKRHIAREATGTSRAGGERRWGAIEALLSVGRVKTLLLEWLLWRVSGRRLLSSLRRLRGWLRRKAWGGRSHRRVRHRTRSRHVLFISMSVDRKRQDIARNEQ